jgi:pimeloyl-ACP methyl ester carboxylesterase
MARFVLVHGAFGGAWCWEAAIAPLQEAGHTVEAIDLPGGGDDPTPPAEVTLDGYAARICEVLAQGEPAVLVGHSMGGVAVTEAAVRCPERIAALAYVAAFVPGAGQSLQALTQLPEGADDQVQANLIVEPPVARLPAAVAPQFLYNCCAPDVGAREAAKLGAQPLAPFIAPVSGEVALDRRLYVHCTQDRAIPPVLQRRMVRERGITDVVELDADHAPMLSRTEELLAALDRFAR